MNLIDVVKNLSTEEQCLAFVEKYRWPNGKVRCLRCGNDKIGRIERKSRTKNKRTRLFSCLEPSCKYQFSATTGTLFADSHLPLEKWFAAMSILVDAKKSVSAKQLQRHLGVNYRTAWYLNHRIREAMAQGNGIIVSTPENFGGEKLSGTIEMDETYVGGKQSRNTRLKKGSNKQVVVGLRQRGGDLRFIHAPDAKANTLYEVIHENVSDDVSRVMTDDSPVYPFAFGPAFKDRHHSINHSTGVYAVGDIHTNTIESAFSLFKRGIVGSFHSVSPKHLRRYLSEFEYRFNRRNHPDLFGATMAHMVRTQPLKYTRLTAN